MRNAFEWDDKKNIINQEKHGITFEIATKVFQDPLRIVIEDITHSKDEQRFLCFGKVTKKIATVRFTLREGKIRIFGAAYWRKGRKIYEQENNL